MIAACLRERSGWFWWEAMHKSVISITKLAAAVAAAVAVSGCEAEKSRNPLSPNVAGPIAGVSISPPTPVNPINGAEVLNTAPVRLVFNNASTNGERPLFYVVEMASDAAFTNKVFAQSKVTPGSTQTTIVVDAALTADRTYYWRAKADDGANESEFSSVAKFDIVVPIVIEAPVPVSPVSGLVASSTRPALLVNNAGVQGRAGRVDTGSRWRSTRHSRRPSSSRASSAAAAPRRARSCPSCRGARYSSGASPDSTARLRDHGR